MRDPKRIRPNWEKLAELHEKFPDWRMSQFILNLLGGFKYDPFYLEDDDFIDMCQKIIDNDFNPIDNDEEDQ